MKLINTELLTVKTLEPKTILVHEGTVCDKMFFIDKGCVRAWYNANGQAITLQFFFEGESVTSLESFLNETPSTIYIETLETCEVSVVNRADFLKLIETDINVKDWFYKTAISKLFTHTNRLLSLLKDKPFDRYQLLLKENPEMLQRIPQHYIASYLGITAVSLSRIRNRKHFVS
jgi:CRP-like cAMP-binding protein